MIQESGNPFLPYAVGRGFVGRCPRCGRGSLFAAFTKPQKDCTACGLPFGGVRTDDFAPYFTILIVGHIIVPLVLFVEQHFAPPNWVHYAAWLPATLASVYYFLPRDNGAIMGWMWWLGLTGDERQ